MKSARMQKKAGNNVMGMIRAAGLGYEYLRYEEEGQEPEVTKAIEDVSLEIQKGQFIAVLGHNGSGKSTLAKHINALLVPTEGTMWVDDMKTTDEEDVWKIRQKAGMVFQNPDNQIIGNIVEEDVGFGPENIGVETKEIWKRVDESLKAVGMTAYRKQSPNKLSGGQKQRVAIARALVNNPKVLLLDEPLGALDLQLRRAMQIELKHLQKKLGITFIYITHDQEEAINMSDRIAVMKDGRIEQIGTPDEIYNHPKTSYVATFVGNANILHGAAERIQGENAIVKIGNDRVIVKLKTSQQNTEDTGVKQYLSAGEKVTLAVRSENILLQETAVIGDTGTDYRDAVDISVADGSLDAHNKNSVSGLQATVTEKNFAGGQLRVTLKLSDGTQLIASRYGIDASVAEGQTVRCSFLPTDAVLVDREDIHEEA